MIGRRRVWVLGIPIDDVTQTEVLDWAEARCRQPAEPALLVTLNADRLLRAIEQPELRAAVLGAGMVTADGVGVQMAARLLGARPPRRVTGSDLVRPLAARAARHGFPLFLLGGEPGVAAAAGAILVREYPGLVLAGAESDATGERPAPAARAPGAPRRGREPAPPFRVRTEAEERALIDRIRRSGARILLVGLGAGREEIWLARHLQALGVAVAIGCGASIDFITGRQRRAPRLLRKLGLEWLYRLVREPRRLWRRYLVGGSRLAFRLLRARLRGGAVDSRAPDP